jgi:hypothetical protein
MNEDKKYNGWTNYETWVVNLWMSNDQGSDEYYRELAQETYNRADSEKSFTRDEVAIRNLADTLEGEFDERQSELVGVTGVFADLLNAAISEVNWHEIAEHYIADVDQDKTEKGEASI